MERCAMPLLARCYRLVNGASSGATDPPVCAGGSLNLLAWVTLDVTAVGAGLYGVLLSSAPQLSACPLSERCFLVRVMRFTNMVGQHTEVGSSHSVQALSPALHGAGGDKAAGPRCEHGSCQQRSLVSWRRGPSRSFPLLRRVRGFTLATFWFPKSQGR